MTNAIVNINIKIKCPSCLHGFVVRGTPIQVKCDKCGRVFPIDNRGKYTPVWGGIKGMKENATGFGYDEHGQLVAVNEKGKRVDVRDTRYDLKNDPHGWRTAGKKVREKDQYGRPND